MKVTAVEVAVAVTAAVTVAVAATEASGPRRSTKHYRAGYVTAASRPAAARRRFSGQITRYRRYRTATSGDAPRVEMTVISRWWNGMVLAVARVREWERFRVVVAGSFVLGGEGQCAHRAVKERQLMLI